MMKDTLPYSRPGQPRFYSFGLIRFVVLISLLFGHSWARIHHLVLNDDFRSHFKVSSFGFFVGGTLKADLSYVEIEPFENDALIGLTLVKTLTKNLKYENELDNCLLNEDVKSRFDIGVMSMVFDFKNLIVKFSCSPDMESLLLRQLSPLTRLRRDAAVNSSSLADPEQSSSLNGSLDSISRLPVINSKSKVSIMPDPKPERPIENVDVAFTSTCRTATLPLQRLAHNKFAFKFHIDITTKSQEGLYSLFFHNCQNFALYGKSFKSTLVDLSLYIEEKNFDSYLSGGQIPLPNLYFFLSIVFFMLGFLWASVLRSRQENVFKIHYLMAVLVFVKAFSLFFHSIDYYCIGMNGFEIETWAILYYGANFLKGALLFITIVLIGTGWAFVKHILNDKDKKIFMLVIPLQVLANVAQIITEETELGELKHMVWRTTFFLVDLLCCGAILFPVVWSIKHLQEASHIDGKAAMNLVKLQLFRRFYVMIVCYIYFTRIIVYLLNAAIPFQFEWVDVLFQHLATLIFFVFTGYHFQPTTTNPYFKLTDEDLEMEEVLFSVTPHMFESSTKKRNREKEEGSGEDKEFLIKSDNRNENDGIY